MKIKTIKIKKKGGGTRLQKVKVLASGKYRFIKNTATKVKSKAKTKTKSKTKSKPKRKPNKKANGKKKSMPRRSGLKGITSSSTLKKVALGVGGATMAAALLSFVAPNSSIGKFAPAAGAYALGGLEGVIGNFALGMIGSRGSTSNANVAPQMEVL
jgi:hypothetical protein